MGGGDLNWLKSLRHAASDEGRRFLARLFINRVFGICDNTYSRIITKFVEKLY